MNPSDQVVSLELAKRLSELEVKQQSLFYWVDLIEPYLVPVITDSDKKIFTALTHDILPPTVFSALTVAELLELLPNRITLKENEPYNNFNLRMERGLWVSEPPDSTFSNIRTSKFYSVNYLCDTTSLEMDWMFRPMIKNICDENPANALAKMLIYLYEQGLIKND